MPADVPDVLAHGPGEEGVGIKRERKGGGGGGRGAGRRIMGVKGRGVRGKVERDGK